MAEIYLWPGNIKAMAQTPSGKVPIRNGNRFAFDGTDQIDFEDAQENLYFSLPNDYAWAANDGSGENVVPVFRVFNTQQGKHYLLIGVPWTWVNAAPNGPLIIDPTITIDNNLDDVTRDTRLQNATKWGSDATLMVGKKSDSVKKRSVLKFDFAYSGIPGNATILNSQLELYYYDAQRAGGSAWVDRWVQAHQVLNNWNELQADSLKRLTGVNWLAPRGKIGPGSNPASEDANGQFESTMLFQSGQTGTWKVWSLTALTQKWINGTTANNGVILWATNEDVNAYDLRFYSRENATNKPKLVVTWSNTAKTVYFLKDHLGSVRATIDQTGAVVGYDDYDPWGYALTGRTMATQWSSAQSVAKNKFTGKERDDDFGINWDYFGARYYDAQIGRWMVRDPLADKYPSLSPFAYTANNPIRRVDPDGKDIWDVVVGVGTSLADNNTGGNLSDAASQSASDQGDFAIGQNIGIAISVVQGGLEIIGGSLIAAAGLGGEGLSLGVSATGVGAIAGVPGAAASAGLIAGGTAVAGHGAFVLNNALSENNGTSSGEGGRSKNDLKPDPKAQGDHTTFKTDKDGNVTKHATWTKNPQNPSGFDPKQRTDASGKPHFNKKTGQYVKTPHTHTKDTPGGVRPAKPEELPKRR